MKAVLSNLFQIANLLALEIHLPRPTFFRLSFETKLYLNLILDELVEHLFLIVELFSHNQE